MWKSLKQRLGFKRMGCCGTATWTPSAPTILTVMAESSPTQMLDDPDQERDRDHAMHASDVPARDGDGDRAPHAPPLSGMNLATALEAERNAAGPPVKTLMRLIEETDGVDLRQGRRRDKGTTRKRSGGGVGCDWVCCVCMDRNKGAAFIPCGHAFCRVCSRELWVHRGCCPICNRPILEILDLF
ncbi:nuclear factor 7, brain-like [Rhodamnia argentea]|uniref:Nuclear factor 7, brain-like n=1 Tax=Rhodamnia argentea TaxID=178133 RepID=A0A8B8QB67_9MYRT|nr:nuclear factor 7, brain-like [Rhodamnia argentea]